MRKALPITSLLVNPQNPRLEEQPSHRDAIRALAVSDPSKLLNLAEHIANYGLSPIDTVGVYQSPEFPGRFVVAEGNRRVAALFCLHTPELVLGVLSRNQFDKLRMLSEEYLKQNPPTSIECELRAEEEWPRWVELRHTGANEGRGLVAWGTPEQQRFLQRTGHAPAIEAQFLDFYSTNSGDPPDQIALVKKVPTSSLRRFLENRHVKKALRIKVTPEGWATSDLPREGLVKYLRRMIGDLTREDFTVRNIYLKQQIEAYFDDLTNELFGNGEVGPGEQTLSSPQATSKQQRQPKAKPKKWTIAELEIKPANSRLRDIVHELEGLSLEKANLHAVMLRVLLEMSVDDFLANRRLSAPPDKGNDVTLGARIKFAADKLEKEQLMTRKQLVPVRRIAGSGARLQSTRTLHDYVHNENLHPNPKDVETLWKDLGHFIRVLQVR